MVIDNCRHLDANRDPRKSEKSLNLFVPGPLTPADLTLVLRFLQIFDKQSFILYIFPHLFQRHLLARGCSSKNSSLNPSRIPLIAGAMQVRVKIESEG